MSLAPLWQPPPTWHSQSQPTLHWSSQSQPPSYRPHQSYQAASASINPSVLSLPVNSTYGYPNQPGLADMNTAQNYASPLTQGLYQTSLSQSLAPCGNEDSTSQWVQAASAFMDTPFPADTRCQSSNQPGLADMNTTQHYASTPTGHEQWSSSKSLAPGTGQLVFSPTTLLPSPSFIQPTTNTKLKPFPSFYATPSGKNKESQPLPFTSNQSSHITKTARKRRRSPTTDSDNPPAAKRLRLSVSSMVTINPIPSDPPLNYMLNHPVHSAEALESFKTDPYRWPSAAVLHVLTSPDSIYLCLCPETARQIPPPAHLGRFITEHAIDGRALLLCTNDRALSDAGIMDPNHHFALGKLIVRFRRCSPEYQAYCFENHHPENYSPEQLIDPQPADENTKKCMQDVYEQLMEKGLDVGETRLFHTPIGCIQVTKGEDRVLKFGRADGLSVERGEAVVARNVQCSLTGTKLHGVATDGD